MDVSFSEGSTPADRAAGQASHLFEPDEGFADGSRSLDAPLLPQSFQAWLDNCTDEERGEIAFKILRTLRLSKMGDIVDRCRPLLHMDPLQRLPTELTAQIFRYLDAKTLLGASLSSKEWRERIMDTALWQRLYELEGWQIDMEEMEKFQQNHNELVRSEFRKAKDEIKILSRLSRRDSKRRATGSSWSFSRAGDQEAKVRSQEVQDWSKQNGDLESEETGLDTDVVMAGTAEPEVPSQPPLLPQKRSSQSSDDDPVSTDGALPTSKLLLRSGDEYRFNWPHIYKQRYRLEQNWLQGRYVNFSLPHWDYPKEGHKECVYTIQFQGRWLVSGSRDKSLRIWDMNTGRLRGKPLIGHTQSVLCLQFDASKEEDVIMSGSSDSSVIIWRFSTGQQLHRINNAHAESVLNLRFDQKYLITCSKDKQIKVWNRKEIRPTDPDYPHGKSTKDCKYPSHIINLQDMTISMIEAGMARGLYKTLRPYSHLMTFESHTAAVNAIQIHDDIVVSASGDRTIKIWNIKTGKAERVMNSHSKGIACIQYDGRRIVSGSSDNTVRIYDPVSGAEVGCLKGHDNLVRTVQAGFGDSTDTSRRDREVIQEEKQNYYAEIRTNDSTQRRWHDRRSREETSQGRVAIGSKLPRGGGGGKWARIVSGSYDESIIIWKKEPSGLWVQGQILRQDDKLRENLANSGSSRSIRPASENGQSRTQGPALNGPTDVQQHVNAVSASRTLHNTVHSIHTTTSSQHGQHSQQLHPAVSSLMSPAISSSHHQLATITPTRPTTAPALQEAGSTIDPVEVRLSLERRGIPRAWLDTNDARQREELLRTRPELADPANVHSLRQLVMEGTNGRVEGFHMVAVRRLQAEDPALVHVRPNALPAAIIDQAWQYLVSSLQGSLPNLQPSTQQTTTPLALRIFKLQFDARRLVCCSQDSRIVGWDFSNGDQDIEECSKFFVGV